MATIKTRNWPDGSTTYRAKIRLRGHRAEAVTFRRLTDARRWVQATEAAIRQGRYFRTAEAKRRTLGDLIDRYIEEIPLAEQPMDPVIQWGGHTVRDAVHKRRPPGITRRCGLLDERRRWRNTCSMSLPKT